jgi:tRNA(fMet)-specific endonuclease VapC
MMYLLDTNVCITLIRGKSSLLLQRINAKMPADIALCSVVIAELSYGAALSKQPSTEYAKIQVFIQPYLSLSFADDAAERFGTLRAHLDKLGMPIGPYDLMIAAIALANGLILVTNNVKKFSRVPTLVIEDWQTS